jgi:4-diphosphocytidyl-2-C-methyl-D-erythritol kinase
MPSLSVQAFAKVNLTLDVFNRRSDGFHSIASVVQTISLHDSLVLTLRDEPGVSVSCEGPHEAGVPRDASNLAARAAQSLLDVARCDSGLHITIHKRIPSQAGLGGGSSDAAAALLGTAALFGLDIGPKLLHDLAAGLGSDVPFFLSGGTAVIRGRGDAVGPLQDAPPLWVVVVKPAESVSTGWAYGALDAMEERASARATKRMEEAVRSGDARAVAVGQSNDFEAVVFRHVPAIAWLRDELLMAGARAAHLCGSGSAVYGIVENEAEAERIAALFRSRYDHATAERTLSRVEANPLREVAV